MSFINFKNHKTNNQKGSIIIYTVLVLLAVMITSIALMKLLIPKFRIVKESIYSKVALYAADSAVEWCIYTNLRSSPTPTPTPIAYIQSKSAQITSNNTLQITFNSSTVVGNLIVVAIKYDAQGRTVNLTDSQGNAYALAKSQNNTGNGSTALIYYAKNIIGGADTVTVVIGGATLIRLEMDIHEYSGINQTSPLDQTASAVGVGTSPSSGNVTTTQAKELLFGMVEGSNAFASTTTAGAGYTLRQNVSRVATEDRIVGSTGTYAATFTTSLSTNWATLIATFKDTSVPAPSLAPSPVMSNGATYTIYSPASSDNASICQEGGVFDHRIIGLFRGIARSLEIF